MKKNKKKELSKLLIKRLNEDGFIFHRRHCEQPSHYGKLGEDGVFIPNIDIIQEDWKNKEFISWLLNIYEREISDEADELNKIINN